VRRKGKLLVLIRAMFLFWILAAPAGIAP